MFSNSYQSGMHIELFNSQNKDLVKHWKFSGKIAKEYDAGVKGYINILNIGGISKMTVPANDKQSLGIVQSYIVFQIYLYSPKSFNIEIAISDTSKTKRRLMFSTSAKDIVINPLHCRIPLVNIPIGVWVNISIDVLSFVSECFKSQTFRSIDFLSITANCKVRRVFSMRNALVEYEKNTNEDFPMEYADVLPKNLALPSNAIQENINLNMEKLKLILESELKMSKENMNLNINVNNTLNHNQNNYYNHNHNHNLISPSNKRNEAIFKTSHIRKSTNTNNANINNQNNINNVKSLSPNNNNNNNPSKINLRSKSVNKPLKNNNGELLNKQEFIESNQIKYDSNSKSPREEISQEKKQPINAINKKKVIEDNKAKLKNFSTKIKDKIILKSKQDKLVKITPNCPNYDLSNGLNNNNKSNILLNTLNYKNMDKWDNSKDNGGDSIEEIFEIDERRTQDNLPDEKDKGKNLLDDNEDLDKMKLEESEDKYYYDIPIKDFKKKSEYKESGNFFNPKLTQQLKETLRSEMNKGEDYSKRKMIEEIFKDSQNTLALIDKDRPFTPPFTKLVPMTKSLDRESVIMEKEENLITSETPSYPNKLVDSLEENNMADLIYDHVLGCYYDPKTNMYYELKN